MLNDYWARHPDLQKVRIYQASGVAKRALTVFQTYVGMMNEDIQKAFQVRAGLRLAWTNSSVRKLLVVASITIRV